MKKLSLLLLAVFLLSGLSFAAENAKAVEETLTVYYFHSTKRCHTCINIENYTEDAVKMNFKSELESGKVVFKSINTDEDENNHYISDYSLFTKSVVVSKTKNGKEENWKNLDKIWKLVRDKVKYYSYIKDEVNLLLTDK